MIGFFDSLFVVFVGALYLGYVSKNLTTGATALFAGVTLVLAIFAIDAVISRLARVLRKPAADHQDIQ